MVIQADKAFSIRLHVIVGTCHLSITVTDVLIVLKGSISINVLITRPMWQCALISF